MRGTAILVGLLGTVYCGGVWATIAYTPAPTITAIAPTEIWPGGIVTVFGTGFPTGISGGNYFTIGGTAATCRYSSPSKLVLDVPALPPGQWPLVVKQTWYPQKSSAPFTATVIAGPATPETPQINSFSPVDVNPGENITFFGTNLGSLNSVLFGSYAATSVAKSTTQAVIGVPPTLPPNTYPVLAISQKGTFTQTTLKIGGFPRVLGVGPNYVSPGGQFSVYGENLTGVTGVSVGGSSARILQITANSISVSIGTIAYGRVPVQVLFKDGTTKQAVILVEPPLTVSSFTPSSAYPSGSLQINGTNLSGAFVLIDGTAAMVQSSSMTQATVLVPGNVRIGSSIPVFVAAPSGASLTTAITIGNPPTLNDPPRIDSFTPSILTPLVRSLTLNGYNLGFLSAVTVGGIGVAITSSTSTTATVSVAWPLPGGVELPVRATTRFNLSGSKTIPVVLPPQVTTFYSWDGTDSVAPGGIVYLEGSNLDKVTSVKFGGVTASLAYPSYPTQLSIRVPSSIITSPSAIALINAATPQEGLVIGSIAVRLPPAITSITPNPVAASAPITLEGSGLSGISDAFIGGQGATVSVSSENLAILLVPAEIVTTPVLLEIATANGTATFNIDIDLPPQITSLSPSAPAIGETLTVSGSGLARVTSVTVGGVAAEIPSKSATALSVKIPTSLTSSPVFVRLVSPAGIAARSTAVSFPAPVITSVEPTSVAPGASLTIRGTGFAGVTQVTIGGVIAPISSSATDSISLTVPTSLTQSPAQIILTARSQLAQGTVTILLPEPPTLTSKGVWAEPGKPLTLVGTHLEGVTAATIANKPAQVQSSTADQVVLLVPTDAPEGPGAAVSVTTKFGTAAGTVTILHCWLGASAVSEPSPRDEAGDLVNVDRPQVAVVASGALALWKQTKTKTGLPVQHLVGRPLTSQGWGSQQIFAANQEQVFLPLIVLNEQGSGFLAWDESRLVGDTFRVYLHTRRITELTTVGEDQIIYDVPTGGRYALEPALKLASGGRAVLTWHSPTPAKQIWAATYDPVSDTWAKGVLFDALALGFTSALVQTPQLEVNPTTAEALVAWCANFSGRCALLHSARRLDDQGTLSWTSYAPFPDTLTQQPLPALPPTPIRNMPQLAVSGPAGFFVSWLRSNTVFSSLIPGLAQLPQTPAPFTAAASGYVVSAYRLFSLDTPDLGAVWQLRGPTIAPKTSSDKRLFLRTTTGIPTATAMGTQDPGNERDAVVAPGSAGALFVAFQKGDGTGSSSPGCEAASTGTCLDGVVPRIFATTFLAGKMRGPTQLSLIDRDGIQLGPAKLPHIGTNRSGIALSTWVQKNQVWVNTFR